MKDYLRRNWWLYLILILACAALPLIQRWEAVPVLSPPSFVFTWYAAVIPIAAAVVGNRVNFAVPVDLDFQRRAEQVITLSRFQLGQTVSAIGQAGEGGFSFVLTITCSRRCCRLV